MAYQNFYATKTGTAIGAADTTITVQTPPSVTSGRLVLEPRNSSKREIISFTGVSGTSLTGVTRGLYGTSATTHASGSLVEMNFLAQDYQDLVDSFNTFAASNSSWWTGLPAVSSVTYNGQRSYDITFVSTVASLLSPGMRLRTTRTVSAPTQCTSLNGTNQYYSKTSPSGMTFTDDFAVSAWVKLSSYPSSDINIISRYNGTSGWQLRVEASGIIRLLGYNGGVANASWVNTYQSLPTNKWVHISGQLDMSAFTASSTTSYIMLDGVDVPVSVGRGGTNPTALIQAGNLEVGSANGTGYFPGKIAQVAIYNAKVTQANIRATISQGLVGNETSLISAYSFNNSINDLTANANNLTANGSAVATNADSPFGAQADGTINANKDYAIVTKVNGTTVTVQVPEGCAIPTSGGVSSLSYSPHRAPYGFPADIEKWTVRTELATAINTSGTATNTIYNPGGFNLTVPVGKWTVKSRLNSQTTNSAALNDTGIGLSTSASLISDPRLFTRNYVYQGAVTFNIWGTYMETPADLTVQTPYYAIYKSASSFSQADIRGDNATGSLSYGKSYIEAQNAYL